MLKRSKQQKMTGLYSANLNNQIYLFDENAQHMFIGSMVRLKDQRI